MAQTIITWLIIALASLFVGRWALRKVKGEAPACCINDDQAPTCSCCSLAKNCTTPKDHTSG